MSWRLQVRECLLIGGADDGDFDDACSVGQCEYVKAGGDGAPLLDAAEDLSTLSRPLWVSESTFTSRPPSEAERLRCLIWAQ
jgi:hypothetical protein